MDDFAKLYDILEQAREKEWLASLALKRAETAIRRARAKLPPLALVA